MSALRSYREKNGLTQLELADKIGISRQMVGALENGWRDYTPEMAVLIEKKLRLNPILFRPDIFRKRAA